MYAKAITKQDLLNWGITRVTKTGTIYKGKRKVKCRLNNSGNLVAVVAWKTTLSVNRIVFCWFNGCAPSGLVIGHCDDNKLNNHINNLQALSPSENIWKNRQLSIRPCKLTRPREYYTDRLASYSSKYEIAKKNKDKRRIKNCRDIIGYIKGQLRYYDLHTQVQGD